MKRAWWVDRPIDEVWAFLTDPFNWPRFVGGRMLAFRQTSPGPRRVGSTLRGRFEILGFEVRGSAVVTEWDPPHTSAFSLSGAGVRSGSLRITLKATADGTQVVRSVEFEPRPTLTLLWWIGWPLIRRQWDATDQNLKRLLEAGRG